MASIVVLGAGIGGMSVAYELRALLGKDHPVTVVGEGEQFSFTPSNPWVAVGWRKPADIQIGVRPYLAKKGIGFEPEALAMIVRAGEGSVRDLEVERRRRDGTRLICLLSAEALEIDGRSCIITAL